MNRSNRPWSLTRAAVSLLALDAAVVHAVENHGPTDAIPPPTVTTRERLAGEDLYLEVSLNGTSTERLVHFIMRDDTLCVQNADLIAIGFKLPPSDALRCLRDLKGTTYSYDAGEQVIHIEAPLDQLNLQRQVLNTVERASTPPTSGTGVLLNYDVYASRGGGLGNVSAFTELRGFSDGLGVLSSTALARRYQVQGQGWQGQTVRLDTQWRLSFPQHSLALTVGDNFTGYTSWSRATRIGGISLGTDFSQQPYRITTPLPQFFGEATAPSSVDLYVDGIRQYSGHVPAGPFQLNATPGIDQAGQAQVVLTDALGRTSTVTFPFYAARQLLRQGIDDWSVDLGKVRENYGTASFSYGNALVGSGTWRRGLTDQFTLEGHAEGGSGRTSAGAGALWNPFGASIFNGSFAGSRGGGMQYGLGYTWMGKFMNVALDSLRSNGSYRDVASSYGSPPPRVSERALVGFTVRESNFGVNYVRLRYSGQPTARYGGLFAMRNFGHGISVNLNYNQNLDSGSDRSIFLGVTLALDNGITTSLSGQRDHNQTYAVADVSRPIDGDGGFGWHVQGRSGENNGGLAEAGWLGDRGQLTVGANNMGPSTFAYADAVGAVVLMGGHAYTSRRIDDAFALVSTDGTPGVPVLLENRSIGQTDSRGTLLVARLNAWQDNRIGIDPLDLPADARIQRVDAVVAPSDRSGVLVRFPVKYVRAATILLVDAAGKPLKVGGTVDTGDGGEPAVIGFDGMVYLDRLQAGNTTLRIQPAEGSACSVTFTYPDKATDLPQLGPFTCRSDAP